MSSQEKCQQIINDIYAMMGHPFSQPVTSGELKDRADRRSLVANQLRMSGRQTRKEYDALDRTEN